MAADLDFTALHAFLKEHDMGVDDLFFVLHLGARQLAFQPDMPADTRSHWAGIAEECHDLWHNTLRSGTRLT